MKYTAFGQWCAERTTAEFAAARLREKRFSMWLLLLVTLLSFANRAQGGSDSAPNPSQVLQKFADPTGEYATFNTRGSLNPDNPFFQDLGSNERRCVTCHQPNDGWTVTPSHLQDRFASTAGRDPIFRTNDGSNSPNVDVSSLNARRSAYSMLLNKGLIRVGLPIPDKAEFSLAEVDDPYGFASAKELSLFRRPLPAANLPFLTTVMWDGRETFPGMSIQDDLMHQANSATEGHAQAVRPLTKKQREAIMQFETASYLAQVIDHEAGDLRAEGAHGGPVDLSRQKFFIGINDPLGQNPTGKAFDRRVFSLFDNWASPHQIEQYVATRRSIVRGQRLFSTRNFKITGVRGLNDLLGKTTIVANCSLCHDTPNVGNHSVAVPLDIGLTDVARRTPDLPLYTLQCNSGPFTGQVFKTTDPGRALVTGKCADIGKFKGPILRGLAARAPYFHNGSAANLQDVVQFYNKRFKIGLDQDEIQDLVHFLQSL